MELVLWRECILCKLLVSTETSLPKNYGEHGAESIVRNTPLPVKLR